MDELRVLVLEDVRAWRDILSELLAGQFSAAIDVAADHDTALRHIRKNKYDLAVVDLLLLGDDAGLEDPRKINLHLLRQLRESQYNKTCAVVVLTAYASTSRILEALREYGAYDFVEKDNFNEEEFGRTLCAALLSSRLRNAETVAHNRYRVSIMVGQDSISGAEVIGPDVRAVYRVANPKSIGLAELARRGDNLNLLIIKGGAVRWRPEAKYIGDSLYTAIADDQHILGDIKTAQTLAERSPTVLWLEFSGPPVTLSVPFELIRDRGDYLSFAHVITRRLDGLVLHNVEPFHSLIADLWKQNEPLRVLVVGANSDGNLRFVETEAANVAASIEHDVSRLGLQVEVTALLGAEATYDNVQKALRAGDFHIFHYAGHGRFDDRLPEVSGLIVQNKGQLRTISAAELNLLVRKTKLRLVYLSCCLGARVSDYTGRGDFYGLLDSLARADVPMVLGYRWTVDDTSAAALAQSFYQNLWRTFCPGSALLDARRVVAIEQGRDDETWAAPVLLMQNSFI